MPNRHLFAFFALTLLLTGCGAQSKPFGSKGHPFIYQVQINLEVDGQPVSLIKRESCKVKTFTKAGGTRFSYVSAHSYAMSHKLPTGEYILSSAPRGCGRFKITQKTANGTPLTYKLVKPLAKDFLPYIAIASNPDKGLKKGIPDQVIIYASKQAYQSPAARIVFKNITISWPGPNAKKTPKDRFDWFVRYRGIGGPDYYGFNFRQGKMIAELKDLIYAHHPHATNPINVKPLTPWFAPTHFYKKVFLPFSPYEGQAKIYTSVVGSSILPSHFEHSTPLKLKEGTNLLEDETYYFDANPEYKGMIIAYYMPVGVNKLGSKRFNDGYRKPFHITLPSRNLYSDSGGDKGTVIYEPIKDNIYHLTYYRHLTKKL